MTTAKPETNFLTDDLADVMAANRAAADSAVARQIPMTTAVIYARSSADADQTGITTAKQVHDGHTYAHARDLPVVGVYKDDGVSAYKPGKVRTDYERLLRDAMAGAFDVVIVRHTDRLYRQLAELPRIVKDLAPYAQILAIHEGEVDLSAVAGILRAQILGAVAEHESRLKGERVASHARHRAHGGRMVTGNRPFGWAWKNPCPADKTCDHHKPHRPNGRPLAGSARAGLVPDPVEAPAVAHIYDMVAGGASLAAAARWLNDHGHQGTFGGKFTAETVRQVLGHVRNAGLVSHLDRLVSEARDGQRIVTPEVWQTVARILADPSRRTSPGRPAGTLLSGIARCGKTDADGHVCGGRMNASNRHYKATPNRPGRSESVVPVYVCGRSLHLGRARHLLDELVLRAVKSVIVDNGDRLAAEARTDADAVELAAQREVDRLRGQLDGFAALVTTMDPADYVAAVNPIRSALREAEAKAAVVTRRPTLARVMAAEDVGSVLDNMSADEDVEPMRALLGELIDFVQVRPGRGPLTEHVTIHWSPWLLSVATESTRVA